MAKAWEEESWHEDDGTVLWWKFPIVEAPYVGSPLDSDWPGYHTHWTQIPIPKEPKPRASPARSKQRKKRKAP